MDQKPTTQKTPTHPPDLLQEFIIIEKSEYIKIFDNAVKHIDCAKILAENKMYGFAISHLVLGVEELVKYQVVMNTTEKSNSFKNEIDPQHKKSIFRNHTTKHNLLKEFAEACAEEFAENFFDSVLLVATNQITEEEHSNNINNRFKEWGGFFALSNNGFNFNEDERKLFIEWLKTANDTKNNGFYANMKNKSIESPSKIQENEYLIALNYVNIVLKQSEFMNDVDLTDDDFAKYMNTEI